MHDVLEPSLTGYRNFNVCPHCEWNGEEALLSRLSEGMPMISRSDGRNFHLLLADRPLPYPIETSEGPTRMTSVCFWHVYGTENAATKSTVVIFESVCEFNPNIFRQIEFIADILADELLRRHTLGAFYNMQANAVLELTF